MITSKITPYNPNDETELSEDGQLCREAILKYGLSPQIEMVTEELAELILAIQKWKRKPCEQTVCDIAGEVADVELMLCQLQYMMDTHIERKYGVHLDEMRGYKRLRLKLRLHGKDQAAKDIAETQVLGDRKCQGRPGAVDLRKPCYIAKRDIEQPPHHNA